MPNETHRAPLRYNISDFFSSLLGLLSVLTSLLREHSVLCTGERSNSTTRDRIEVAQCRSKGENYDVLANNEASFEMLSACRKTHSAKGIGPSRWGTRFELGCCRRRIGPEC